jgi:hypothetical protein
MSEWQPIETAPKDGRDVLLGWISAKHVLIGRWGNHGGRYSTDGWRDREGFALSDGPDVWMPLPEPPR